MTRKGRKRSPKAKRHPGGRIIQPSTNDRDLASVVLGARQRVHGLTEAQASQMPETTILGRLRATGEITARQYEAGVEYRQVVSLYDKAMMVRKPESILAKMAVSKDEEPPRREKTDWRRPYRFSDGSDDDYVEWFEMVLRVYDRCERALVECPDRMAKAAVNACALADFDAPHFVGSLRIGLNALARVLDVSQEERAA